MGERFSLKALLVVIPNRHGPKVRMLSPFVCILIVAGGLTPGLISGLLYLPGMSGLFGKGEPAADISAYEETTHKHN